MKKKVGVQIFGENELARKIRKGEHVKSHCISIRNSSLLYSNESQPFPLPQEIQNGFKDILHLEFHDVSSKDLLPPHLQHHKIPELSDIHKTIAFVKTAIKDPDFTGFTIHCWRGVSRSSAIALGVLYMICKDEEKAARYIINIRKEAAPLMRIVKFWDDVFGSNLAKQGEIIRDTRFQKMKADLMESLRSFDEDIEELEPADDEPVDDDGSGWAKLEEV